SHAASCIVTLAHDGIVVSDDGIGVSSDAVDLVFRGLRERVAAAGATLHISDAHPGTRRPGTRLEVRW
ncbi:hypothetical protein, partial [Bacillus sp. SIMBA_005]|uniref:hypothetical protein n=1 Tax=Bacillus sp. SIMBA_005 TaxID=3085754 RepID=UPI00397C4F34